MGELLIEYHLKLETLAGSRTWFAWVPTEANISDFPSRGVPHPLLVGNLDVSADAKVCLSAVLEFLTQGRQDRATPESKTVSSDCFHCFSCIDGQAHVVIKLSNAAE